MKLGHEWLFQMYLEELINLYNCWRCRHQWLFIMSSQLWNIHDRRGWCTKLLREKSSLTLKNDHTCIAKTIKVPSTATDSSDNYTVKFFKGVSLFYLDIFLDRLKILCWLPWKLKSKLLLRLRLWRNASMMKKHKVRAILYLTYLTNFKNRRDSIKLFLFAYSQRPHSKNPDVRCRCCVRCMLV